MAKIDQYATDFAAIILEEIAAIPSKLAESPHVSIDDGFIIMKEFLLLELHLCDKITFGFLGADVRQQLMERIITQIAVRVDESRKVMLNNMLDTITLDNFAVYLKRLNMPTGEGLIDDFNRVQVEYSKYKLTKQIEYKSVAGILEWEFGKKIAFLLRHENETSYIEWIATWAKGLFFKLLVKFKGVVDKYQLGQIVN